MVKRHRKQLSGILAALTVLLICCISVLAAPSGTIQVIVQSPNGSPASGINVELIQVTQNTGGERRLMADFASLGISTQQLHDNPSPEYAEAVFQYAYAAGLEGTIKFTSDQGTVDFYSLKEGVYLVCEHGGQALSFRPFLVVIPAKTPGGEDYFVVSIPKTSDTDVRTLVCVKLWEDELAAAGERPDSIQITLLRDGVPFRTATLNAANDWQYKFHSLPKDGTYTVVEDPVSAYKAEYLPAIEGYIVVNTYVGGTTPEVKPTHVSVSKVWQDDDNAAGKRPASITVQLIQENTVIQTATLSAANHWQYTFTGLDSSKSYTVKEIAVPEYSATYQGTASTGIVIINTHNGSTDPGTPPPPVIPDPNPMDIPVRVEWVDQDNAAKKRPETVSISLIAGGSIISSLQLDANCGWAGVFRAVPSDLPYTVWQNGVAEYTTTYGGNSLTGFIVTNTYTEDITDPGIPPDPDTPPTPGEDPSNPEKPPADPTIPQTGEEVLPVYLLMAAGILLVFFGLIDLYRGRERYEEED